MQNSNHKILQPSSSQTSVKLTLAPKVSKTHCSRAERISHPYSTAISRLISQQRSFCCSVGMQTMCPDDYRSKASPCVSGESCTYCRHITLIGPSMHNLRGFRAYAQCRLCMCGTNANACTCNTLESQCTKCGYFVHTHKDDRAGTNRKYTHPPHHTYEIPSRKLRLSSVWGNSIHTPRIQKTDLHCRWCSVVGRNRISPFHSSSGLSIALQCSLAFSASSCLPGLVIIVEELTLFLNLQVRSLIM